MERLINLINFSKFMGLNGKALTIFVDDIANVMAEQSQDAIASKIKISQGALSKILNRKIKNVHPATFEKICRGLDLDPEKYRIQAQSQRVDLDKLSKDNDLDKFENIYAYDVPGGVTYVGLYERGTLKDACCFPTIKIVQESGRCDVSIGTIIRHMYLRRVESGHRLDTYQNFRNLEAIASSLYLGNPNSNSTVRK